MSLMKTVEHHRHYSGRKGSKTVHLYVGRPYHYSYPSREIDEFVVVERIELHAGVNDLGKDYREARVFVQRAGGSVEPVKIGKLGYVAGACYPELPKPTPGKKRKPVGPRKPVPVDELRGYVGELSEVTFGHPTERAFAAVLGELGIRWDHESHPLVASGKTLVPDFYLPEWNLHVEITTVTGNDPKGRTRRRVAEYLPTVNYVIIAGETLAASLAATRRNELLGVLNSELLRQRTLGAS
jgi:hypothetical protein